jgi:hypothetical protein
MSLLNLLVSTLLLDVARSHPLQMEGDRLFRIVSPGTGSESSVSSRENLFAKHELDNRKVLSDSAVVGHFKNPQELELSGGVG